MYVWLECCIRIEDAMYNDQFYMPYHRSLEHNLNELKASFAENPPPRSESTSSLLSKIKKGHFYA